MAKRDIVADWFSEYGHDVYDYLVYYTGSSDVEDLVQEVFIKAMKGISHYKKLSTPKTWLFTIARNVAIDAARKRKRNKWFLSTNLDERIQDNPNNIPEKLFDDNETRMELYLAIQSLKSNYRDVLILRGIKDLTVGETATVLGWPDGQVRTTYYRALSALRKKQRGDMNE